MFRSMISTVTVLLLSFSWSGIASADKPETLLGEIMQWRYPEAEIGGATMSDAETLGSKGARTVVSLQRRTVMTTPDSVEKVIEFYKQKMKRKLNPDASPTDDPKERASGSSFNMHRDSEGRSVEIHIITVNEMNKSTTLVISRTDDETETHIAFTQYQRI